MTTKAEQVAYDVYLIMCLDSPERLPWEKMPTEFHEQAIKLAQAHIDAALKYDVEHRS